MTTDRTYRVRVRCPRSGAWRTLPGTWTDLDQCWDDTKSYREGDEPAAEIEIALVTLTRVLHWRDVA